jgi:CHAT domain-containing protein
MIRGWRNSGDNYGFQTNIMILPALLLAAVASVSDVEHAIRDFFSAYAAGDAAGASRYWTGDEREAFAKKAAIVTAARCMRLESINVTPLEIEETSARARVTTRITAWSSTDPGRPRQLHEQRTIQLTRTTDGWRITRWPTDEEEAIARIDAASDRERPALLAAVPRTAAMSVLLGESAVRASNRSERQLARQLADLSYAIAVERGDPGAIAVALSVESVYQRLFHGVQAGEAAAVASLQFAEGAGDPDVTALTLMRRARVLDGDQTVTRRAMLHRVLSLRDHLTDLATVAMSATQLAIMANNGGNFREEMRYALMAFEYAELSGDRTALLSAMMNAAGCYYHQGDWELAVTYFTRVRELARELRFAGVETHAMRRLARAHELLGQTEIAESLRTEAMAVAERACWSGSVSEVHAEKAAHLLAVHDLEGAERETVSALRMAFLSDEDYDRVVARLLYADIAQRRGRNEEARSVATAEVVPSARLISGRALHALGRLDEAAAHFEEGIAIIERARGGVLSNQRQQQSFIEYNTHLYIGLVEVLVDQGEFAKAWATARRLKARVLREVLDNSGAAGVSDTRDREDERRLTEEIRALNAAMLEATQAEQSASIRAELDRVRLQFHDLVSRTRGTAAEYRVMSGAAAEGDAGFKGQLPDAVLLDYVVSRDRTIVFVVRDDGSLSARTIPAGSDELWRLTRELRTAIEQRDLRAATLLSSMHALLLGPLKIADAKMLCIVPSGPLWNVPFHALLNADGIYEIEKRAIVYAPAPTLFRRDGAPRQGKPTLLAFGNPHIRAVTAARYRALDPQGTLGAIPEVEEEVTRVAALYGRDRGRAYIGEAAREAVLKREAPSFDVLHIATHGLVDDRAPMYSALVLSTAPGEEEDGLLEAREIAGLKLSTRIAVLSACDTGRGQITTGQGVIGLSWALLAAGCPTAVVSQWKAVSSTTATMMVDFHRHLVRGADAPEALRQAQLALRRDPRFAHPFYWAPFVVVGAPR